MLKSYIKKITEKIDLSEEEMFNAMNIIMTGKAENSQLAAFLVGLKMKGETVAEISAAVRVMREKSTKMKAGGPHLIDTCGTGGDRKNTFNISTASAFVAAAAGAVVAKHGNRAVSSKCGSSDVLRELGVNIDIPIEKVEECISETGIGFLFAPIFHFAMKYAAGVRKELEIRTIFNILGPMTNPAGAPHQIIGVFSLDFAERMASVLSKLGTRHAMLFNGDGLDEV
ncbi:MAG: anthranilate phosphoribosyltransferase, partial [Fibrobacterota bacterium]